MRGNLAAAGASVKERLPLGAAVLEVAPATQRSRRRREVGVLLGGEQRRREVRAEWVGEGDMRDQPVPEERRIPASSAIDDLVRHHEVEGFDVLAKAADGADRDDLLHAEGFEGVDVRLHGEVSRQDTVAGIVAASQADNVTPSSIVVSGFRP